MCKWGEGGGREKKCENIWWMILQKYSPSQILVEGAVSTLEYLTNTLDGLSSGGGGEKEWHSVNCLHGRLAGERAGGLVPPLIIEVRVIFRAERRPHLRCTRLFADKLKF